MNRSNQPSVGRRPVHPAHSLPGADRQLVGREEILADVNVNRRWSNARLDRERSVVTSVRGKMETAGD